TYRDVHLFRIGNAAGDHMRIILNAARKLRIDRSIVSYARIADLVGNITPDVWHTVTTKLTGGGSANGGLQVLLDGVELVAQTGLDFTGTGWKATRVDRGACNVTGTSHTGFIYLDDGTLTATGLVAPTPGATVAAPTNVAGA